MKYIVLVVLIVLSFAFASPAFASFCRQSHDQEICILRITRSAKHYWEYRASVSINGVKRPMEIYNCRDRIMVQKDGNIVPFEPSSAGELICSTLED